MKRSLPKMLAMAGLFCFGTAGAQNIYETTAKPEYVNAGHAITKQGSSVSGTAKAQGSALFYEDFENGLAGNNAFGAWTTDGQDGALWVHDFDGPQGQYTQPTDLGLQSASTANGWMMFDGDASNPGPPSGFENREGFLISPVMDLTGYPNVHLELAQSFRFCCSYEFRLRVAVSTDGFQTFEQFVISDPYARNERPPNPVNTRLSISSALMGGDLSNVQIRFEWEGLDLDPNLQGTSHYWWMVDDVTILESPNNDIWLTQAEYSDFSGTGELEYSIYPFSQVRPITFKGWLLNDGVNDQSGVIMDIAVNGGGAYSGTTAPILITSLQSDTALGTTTFTPPASAETYLVEYTASQDSIDDIPSNNDTISTFEVQEFIFARDRGASDGSTDNQGEAYELCNLFDMTADADLTSIDVAFDNDCTVGAIVDGTIVDANLDPLGETVNEYEIEAADLNNIGDAIFKNMVLDDPLTLFAGETYGVCLRHFGGTDTVGVATSGNSKEQTSFIYDTPTTTWFYTTETPMIRANFDPAVTGIEENDLGISTLSAFPNPTDQGSVIRFSLENSIELSFEVHDINGKVVHTEDLGQLPQGAHQVQLDTRDFQDGVYFYSLNGVQGRLTERLIVIR